MDEILTQKNLYAPVYVIFRRIFSVFYGTWISKNRQMARHVAVHVWIRRYQHIVPYAYISDNCRIDPDPYTISYYRRTFSLSPIFRSDDDSFVYIAVVAYHNLKIDSYVIAYPKYKPLPILVS